jgi:IPT/TIG domain
VSLVETPSTGNATSVDYPPVATSAARAARSIAAYYDASYPKSVLGTKPPTLTSLAPASIVANAAAVTVTITGTGFVAASKVLVDGVRQTTTYVDATHVSYQAQATSVGHQDVRVENGSRPSSALSLTVTATVGRRRKNSTADPEVDPPPEPEVPEPEPEPEAPPEEPA